MVLLRGFPFDSRTCSSTGLVAAITGAVRSVIAADRRGGGRSARPHDPRAYAGTACAQDGTSCSITSVLTGWTSARIRSVHDRAAQLFLGIPSDHSY